MVGIYGLLADFTRSFHIPALARSLRVQKEAEKEAGRERRRRRGGSSEGQPSPRQPRPFLSNCSRRFACSAGRDATNPQKPGEYRKRGPANRGMQDGRSGFLEHLLGPGGISRSRSAPPFHTGEGNLKKLKIPETCGALHHQAAQEGVTGKDPQGQGTWAWLYSHFGRPGRDDGLQTSTCNGGLIGGWLLVAIQLLIPDRAE